MLKILFENVDTMVKEKINELWKEQVKQANYKGDVAKKMCKGNTSSPFLSLNK